mmetsp:Transcript_34494/g.70564  ORF Transcript_34494/g.70564 Transcript_34494/m.70564 type:complete len:242 (-) Transcript_34494:11-736(-)
MPDQHQHHCGAFFIALDKNDPDFITVTLGIPKTFQLPWIGHISAEMVGLITVSLTASYMIWKGHRTFCNVRNYIKDKIMKPLEIEQTKQSPVKAKKWDNKTVNSTKLEEFIDTCKDAKNGLKKVEDPDTVAKRIERRNKLREEEKVKPKGKLGLSDDLLQNARGGLKPGGLENLVQKEDASEKKLSDSERQCIAAQDKGTPLLQKQRARLRSGPKEERHLKDQDMTENNILDYRAVLKPVR